jgi:hypothetical protein
VLAGYDDVGNHFKAGEERSIPVRVLADAFSFESRAMHCRTQQPQNPFLRLMGGVFGAGMLSSFQNLRLTTTIDLFFLFSYPVGTSCYQTFKLQRIGQMIPFPYTDVMWS